MITINDHSSLEYIFYHRRFRIKGTTTYEHSGSLPLGRWKSFLFADDLRFAISFFSCWFSFRISETSSRSFLTRSSSGAALGVSWSSILISWFSAFGDVDAIILAWLQRGRQCPFTNNGQISLLSSTTTLLVTLVSRCFTWQQSLVSPQYHAQCSIFTRLHMLSRRIKFFVLGSLVGYRCTFGVSSACVCLFAS